MIEELVIAINIPTGVPPEYDNEIVDEVFDGFGTSVQEVVISEAPSGNC